MESSYRAGVHISFDLKDLVSLYAKEVELFSDPSYSRRESK